MKRESHRTTVILVLLALAFCAMGSAREAGAGTTGKVTGKVLDKGSGQPVLAATVTISGTRLGAITNAEGSYTILNVSPGAYEVMVKRLGYKLLTIQNINVTADETSRVDAALEVTAIATEEVRVVAERPAVDVNLTSSKESVSSEQIEALPVQELHDVVNLQAGVVDGHIRGGREEEVQYQVDGVTVNNPFNNASSIRLDRSVLQEVQVISGTFDAEYGQAMSGVVNAVLKSGTEKFDWKAEAYGGGFLFMNGGDRREIDNDFKPAGVQNYQLTASGPLAAHTLYLVSGHRYSFDDYVYGERRFLPTDSINVNANQYFGTGDGARVPLGSSREWSGLGKVTNTSLPNTKLSYQFLFDVLRNRDSNYSFRYNPEGLNTKKTTSVVHGLDVTQTFGGRTFVDFSVRQNYLDYTDLKYDSVFDPRYDQAGRPRGDADYEFGTAVLVGVDLGRFAQKTNAVLFKTSLNSQVDENNLVKVGGELQLPSVSFGEPGHLGFTLDTVTQREVLTRYNARRISTYNPVIGALYAQDQLEWQDLTLRGGLRMEYFDARSSVPGDLANPANTISGAPAPPPRATTAKSVLAPRLGVAYPITDKAGVHFAYGHFYQYPSIGQIFTNADYSILATLQAEGITYGVMGNPDVRAEKTVAYEFGYKQQVNDRYSFEVTAFYKDIRDLLGTEFITTYNGAEYPRLTNVDFGSVMGLTLSLDQRRIGHLTTNLNYTWTRAVGQASDPNETATRAALNEDPRPRLVPLDWDQRHTLNLTTTLAAPGTYALSAIFRLASGQPYTPNSDVGLGSAFNHNSGRKPMSFSIDLRAEKKLTSTRFDGSLFGRVFNLTDTRFFNGGVFDTSGSPFYSRFPTKDRGSLQDPTRLYAPRRVEIGISLAPGSAKD